MKTVFFAFRIMLGIGFFMIAAALFGALLWWRGTLFTARWYLRVMAQSWWIGFVAVIAGWVVTETGRQPWIVYGMPAYRRRDLAGRGWDRAGSLALFVVVYWHRLHDGHLLHQPADRDGPRDVAAETGHFGGSPLSSAEDVGRDALRE